MKPAGKALALGVLFISTAALELSASERYILFSPNGRCSSDGIDCGAYFSTYHVFINLIDVTDAVGASFRLESDTFEPGDFVSEDPHDDVTVVSGNLFSGIELNWPEGSYVNDTLLTVQVTPGNYSGWEPGRTVDVEVYRADGDTLHLVEAPFYCSHCYGGVASIYWYHPATFEVPAGADTALAVGWRLYGSNTGSSVVATDESAWVSGCTNCSVWVGCGGCPWETSMVRYMYVDVLVPADAAGTENVVTLSPTGGCCEGQTTSFVVKAVEPVATETTSWGSLKSGFKTE